MTSLIHANNFNTTLNGAITNSQTTMVVNSVTGAPTVGAGKVINFTITDGVNYEIVQATALSSFTYTITRGAEGSTARAWSNATTVEINCTRDSLDLKLDIASTTSTPTANATCNFDANSNLSANNFLSGFTSTATAAGTTTLVVGSTQQQVFTGSTTQTCTMPVVSTLALGTVYIITNLSTGIVTTKSSGANTIVAMASNTTLVLQSNATSGTTASVWNIIAYYPAANTPVGVPLGGTGLSVATAYAVLCGGTTTTGALQSIAALGSSGARLTSNGAGALPSMKGGLAAFRAYRSATQTITSATATKVQCDTEDYDTGGIYDNTVNYRCTPTIAGKYLFINCAAFQSVGAPKTVEAIIYLNGSGNSYNISNSSINGTDIWVQASAILTMNGSTDFTEFYCYQNDSVSHTVAATFTFFAGCLLEAT